jgi:hypothetical protein
VENPDGVVHSVMNKKLKSVRALKQIIDDDYAEWAGVSPSINPTSPGRAGSFTDENQTTMAKILTEESKRMETMNHPMRETVGMHLS